jgi:hypothetical protein
MRPFLRGCQLIFTAAAQSFHQALHHPQQAQQAVKQSLIQGLQHTAYGQQYGINSLDDWSRLPIVNYADIAPWIERQRSGFGALTSEPILFYERTSGSSGPVKWIPYTRSLRRSFNHLFCIWAADLLQHGPRFTTGKLYFCISPQLTDMPWQRALTVPDDSDYLDLWLQWLLKPFLVMPSGLKSPQTPEQFRQRLAIALLKSPRLEIISIWNPSFLTVQLDYIQRHQQKLYDKLHRKMGRNRAALLLESRIDWTALWPNLKLISCWDSVNAADSAQGLRTRFPYVFVQGKGLLATEAPLTVPLIPAQGCVPLINQVLFEFEDSCGSIYSLEQIKLNQPYGLIISQFGGLYRYRLGDQVQATHTYHQTPCLEFLGRQGKTSDLVGEKLTEQWVSKVLSQLSLTGANFRCLMPQSQPMSHYVLLLDMLDPQIDTIELAQTLDRVLSEAFHYQQARLLGQLAPAQVLIDAQFCQNLMNKQMRTQVVLGGVKHTILWLSN